MCSFSLLLCKVSGLDYVCLTGCCFYAGSDAMLVQLIQFVASPKQIYNIMSYKTVFQCNMHQAVAPV